MTIEGGCHCGRVRYAVEAGRLDDVAICHCTACRATSGGTHMTWATVPAAAFRWTRGAPKPTGRADHGTRWFCPDCGTQMAFVTSRAPDRIDLAVTTTDDPASHPPTRHVWLGSKLPWVTPEPGLVCEDGETP
ncbi:MAG: GFA family protein [Lentisphaerae bacterium]|nr:GFA family protein [Lentisphaerota bacterium]